jgi:hypothetical protein
MVVHLFWEEKLNHRSLPVECEADVLGMRIRGPGEATFTGPRGTLSVI